MKKLIFSVAVTAMLTGGVLMAQDIKSSQDPAVVAVALIKKYPAATKVSWEKENGNYEANWEGKSGEDMSVMFTPAGVFVEQVAAIQLSTLPAAAAKYLQVHYKGAKITEAGKVTDAKGQVSYEVEVKGKELVFDAQGNFIKAE